VMRLISGRCRNRQGDWPALHRNGGVKRTRRTPGSLGLASDEMAKG
jgi:hypothetical protein